MVGAIVWELPGQSNVGVVDQLRLLPSMARINGRLYYLPLVGVEPEWQGRGLGTALIRPILERCDDEKVPAYLEATTPSNRARLVRLGGMIGLKHGECAQDPRQVAPRPSGPRHMSRTAAT